MEDNPYRAPISFGASRTKWFPVVSRLWVILSILGSIALGAFVLYNAHGYHNRELDRGSLVRARQVFAVWCLLQMPALVFAIYIHGRRR